MISFLDMPYLLVRKCAAGQSKLTTSSYRVQQAEQTTAWVRRLKICVESSLQDLGLRLILVMVRWAAVSDL